ncbi:hypothetical protein ABCR94_29280 [Streptomyces sp. 21So2-11]|uniref:hypothetical protein n=1 Tax=Streptomyces sp. 21So2-11 TaxID=3144408 RepID=UPI00321BEA23
MPPGTTTRWIASGIRCAGAGSWITIPLPLRSTARLRWLTAPDGSGFLNDLPTLEYLIHDAVAPE